MIKMSDVLQHIADGFELIGKYFDDPNLKNIVDALRDDTAQIRQVEVRHPEDFELDTDADESKTDVSAPAGDQVDGNPNDVKVPGVDDQQTDDDLSKPAAAETADSADLPNGGNPVLGGEDTAGNGTATTDSLPSGESEIKDPPADGTETAPASLSPTQ